ncbi:hypothetical protein Q1695_007578 [Nippostrongylus brasiliensis]|nr:hypothetical protein Q1695_007578 [Nippostrongylus brasiliensis]
MSPMLITVCVFKLLLLFIPIESVLVPGGISGKGVCIPCPIPRPVPCPVPIGIPRPVPVPVPVPVIPRPLPPPPCCCFLTSPSAIATTTLAPVGVPDVILGSNGQLIVPLFNPPLAPLYNTFVSTTAIPTTTAVVG